MTAALSDAVFGGLAIKQCSNADFAPNNQIDVGRASGDVDPSALYLGQGEPRARWTSTDLATILAGLSVQAGLYVASGTLSIPWRVRAAGGTYLGATSHLLLSGTKGLVWPASFEANQQDAKARCNLECAFLSSNGIAEPVTSAVSQSISAASFTNEFRLGPAYVNTVLLGKVVGITINTGIQVEMEYADGGVFPTDIYITQRDPTIDVRFRDQNAVDTYGPLFLAGTAFVGYLRKKAVGGTVVANATPEHISFTFADSIISVESLAAAGVASAEPGLRITGETLTASATAAIP